MEIATLVIAALGVLLGAASLAWQGATYALTGGRVTTTLKIGALADGYPGMVLSKVASATPETLASMASQGYSRPIVAVEVRNIGRLPVTVSRWSMESSLGAAFVPLAESIGPSMPHRLDVGESATWALDLHTAATLADVTSKVFGKNGQRARIRGVVELGDGRTYKTPESF